MQIELIKIGKRFNRNWIFKDVDFTFKSGSKTVIKGANGSGKSTLLKIISTAEIPSAGELSFTKNNQSIALTNVYSSLTFIGPYVDLPSEFTLSEICAFHLKFKHFLNGLSVDNFTELVQLGAAKNKRYKNFSSGMKQRLKLGLAICSNSSLLLLDEPCSNLDADGRELYKRLLNDFTNDRTVIIASNNDKDEINGIQNSLLIKNFQIQP